MCSLCFPFFRAKPGTRLTLHRYTLSHIANNLENMYRKYIPGHVLRALTGSRMATAVRSKLCEPNIREESETLISAVILPSRHAPGGRTTRTPTERSTQSSSTPACPSWGETYRPPLARNLDHHLRNRPAGKSACGGGRRRYLRTTRRRGAGVGSSTINTKYFVHTRSTIFVS